MNVRSAALVLLLPAFILAVSYGTYRISQRQGQEISHRLEQIKIRLIRNDWEGAGREARFMQKDWKTARKTWGLIMDHKELDSMDISISRLCSLISSRERALALAEAAVALRLAGHIPEREIPGVGNIF